MSRAHARAFRKWQGSDTVIGHLLNSVPRTRGRSWVSASSIWLRQHGASAEDITAEKTRLGLEVEDAAELNPTPFGRLAGARVPGACYL